MSKMELPFQGSNVSFINAVVNWLSLFPGSGIKIDPDYTNLADPSVIIEIFKLLNGPEFDVALVLEENGTERDHFLVANAKEEVYERIFTCLKSYYKSKKSLKTKLDKYLGMLDYDDLPKGDLFALNVLCYIFLEVGLHGYKSSFSISIISELNEEDQKEIKNVMYAGKDLFGKNLMLNQRLGALELENSKLKESLKKIEKEQKIFQRTFEVNENEFQGTRLEYEKALHDKDLEVERLKSNLSMCEKSNDDIKQVNLQLKNDLEDLSKVKTASIRKTPLVNFGTPPPFAQGGRQFASDELKWEYNLLTRWLNRLYSNKKSRH